MIIDKYQTEEGSEIARARGARLHLNFRFSNANRKITLRIRQLKSRNT